MTRGHTLRAWDWRQVGLRSGHADLPVALRWRLGGSLRQSVRDSLLEPEFVHANDAHAWPDGGQPCCFLAATSLPGRQPAYAVAVVDHEGRLRFRETLQFRFAARGEGPRPALPDLVSVPRLERLANLLGDQTVYVPDELAADLDGLREPLSQAPRVHSLSPILARKARAAGGGAAQSLSDWVDRAFDATPDPVARAKFMRLARDWAAVAAEQGRT